MGFLRQGLIFLGFVLVVTVITGGLHKIDEGHVGVYYTGGVLSNRITEPGYNVLLPFITTYYQVQVSVQTDQVTEIPCGTSGGVLIYFDKIEVVNKLKKEFVYDTVKNYTIDYDRLWIYDKIHNEINQFCTKHTLEEVYITLFDTLDEILVESLQIDLKVWAPGVEILGVRVTKPRIPESIRKNYEEMESERTRLLIVTENQKVQLQEAETKKQQEIIRAKSRLEVAKINIQRETNEKVNQKKISDIENKMALDRTKIETDAEFYKATRELETLQQKFSKEFLESTAVDALVSNVDFYIGNDIPDYFGGNLMKDKKL